MDQLTDAEILKMLRGAAPLNGTPPPANPTGSNVGDMSNEDLMSAISNQNYIKGVVSDPKGENEPVMQNASPGLFKGLTDAATRGFTGGLADPVRALGRTVGDKIGSAIAGDDPVSFGDTYNLEAGKTRADEKAFSRANKYAGGTAEIAAMMANPASAAAGQFIARGPTMMNRTLRGLVTGAGGGAAYEGSTAEPGKNLEKTLEGLGTGALLGAGSVPFVEVALGFGRGAFQKLTESYGGDLSKAGRHIAEAIRNTGGGDLKAGIERVKRRIKTFGQDTVLADVIDGGSDLASGAALVPGPTRKAADAFVDARRHNRPKRLQISADNIASGDYHTQLEAIVAKQRQASAPLYEKAFAPKTTKVGRVVVQWDEHLERIINDPDMKRGMAQGIKIIRRDANADNIPFNYEEYAIKGFNEDGTLIFGGTPNLRVLDAGKRGLDQEIEAAKDVFGNIQWTPDLRSIENFRKKLVAKLDDMTTDEDGVSLYKKARAEWAGPAQQVDSMKMGRRFMKGDEEVSKKVFDAMTPDNQSQFLLGVRHEVTKFINSNTETAVNKFGDNKADLWIRFENLLPAEKFKAFKSSIDIEIKKAQNEKLINPNYGSPTERNRQNVENLSRAPGFVTDFLDSGATAGKSGMISALARGGKDWLKRPSKKVAGELLDTLLEMDPSKQSALLDAIGTGTAMDKFAPFLSKDRAAQLASIVAARTPTMIQSLLRDKEEIEGQRGSRLERKPMKNALGAN
mgnify:CR=1 FL=1